MLNWVDLELLGFIERYATGRIHWTLAAYFGNHPHCEATLQTLSEQVGIHADNLRHPLQVLVERGLVEIVHVEGESRYRLTHNERLRAMARRFGRQSSLLSRHCYQAHALPCR